MPKADVLKRWNRLSRFKRHKAIARKQIRQVPGNFDEVTRQTKQITGDICHKKIPESLEIPGFFYGKCFSLYCVCTSGR